MYDKFWELAGKTKKLMGIYILLFLILASVKMYLSPEAAPNETTTASLELISFAKGLITTVITLMIQLPIAGFILEKLFDKEHRTIGYYLKKWLLPCFVATAAISLLITLYMLPFKISNHPVMGTLTLFIIALILCKFSFWQHIAINEDMPVWQAFLSSWKRLGYMRWLKMAWYMFVAAIPFIIISVVLAALSVVGTNSNASAFKITAGIIQSAIALIGYWVTILVSYVHYWNMLKDEGKIAIPQNAENAAETAKP